MLSANERQGRPKKRTRDKSKDRSKSQKNHKAWKCYKYHQPDHIRSNFPLLKNEKGMGTSKGGLTSRSGALSSKDSEKNILIVSDEVIELDNY